MPSIVVVDGHGGDKTAWYSYYTGVLYAQPGAVVVTYDPIGSEERNDDHAPLSIEHDKVIDVPTLPLRMGGLMITDAMQGVSYLRSRSDVGRYSSAPRARVLSGSALASGGDERQRQASFRHRIRSRSRVAVLHGWSAIRRCGSTGSYHSRIGLDPQIEKKRPS